MFVPPCPFTLSIERLVVPVHLGVGEEERAVPQTVYVSVQLAYQHLPDATRDDAADYLCYDGLCRKLLDVAAAQSFHLIEFLAAEMLRTLRAAVPPQAGIRLTLHKPLPFSLVGYAVDGATVELYALAEDAR